MKKIFKYKLQETARQQVTMPVGYKILKVDVQFDEIVMWVLVDPEITMVKSYIRMVGTGHEIEKVESLNYIGSVQRQGGALILHVFVEKGVGL